MPPELPELPDLPDLPDELLDPEVPDLFDPELPEDELSSPKEFSSSLRSGFEPDVEPLRPLDPLIPLWLSELPEFELLPERDDPLPLLPDPLMPLELPESPCVPDERDEPDDPDDPLWLELSLLRSFAIHPPAP
jgi:hypothetical protein